MKTVKIYFQPEDFIGNSFCSNTDCPLARASKRLFKLETSCSPITLSIWPGKVYVWPKRQEFKILNIFGSKEYEKVKSQYDQYNNLNWFMKLITPKPRPFVELIID